MGTTTAMGFKDSVDEGLIDLETAITYHLQCNHYPPVPVCMVKTCIEAIVAAESDEWDSEVKLPEGVLYRGSEFAPVWAVVQSHHLESFITAEDD